MTNQTGQSLDGVIDGLLALTTSAFSATHDPSTGWYYGSLNGQHLLVCEGDPGVYQSDLIVGVATAVRQPVTTPTMGTGRSRERAAEIDVVFSAFVPGGEASQSSARRQCTALVDAFEDYFRTAPNETLANACRLALVTNIDGPAATTVVDPTSGSVTGRVAEATVTVTAYIRY